MKCYTEWYAENAEGDVSDDCLFYRLQYGVSKIIVGSDMDFGGRKDDGTCALAYKPLTLGAGGLEGVNASEPYTISNFCYISENDDASFITVSAYSASSTADINFEDAYVESRATQGRSAVLAPYENGSTSLIKNVTISNATVIGDTAAVAFASTGAEMIVSKLVVKNSTVTAKYAGGGVFGTYNSSSNMARHNLTMEGVSVTASDAGASIGCFAGTSFNLSFDASADTSKIAIDNCTLSMTGYTTASTGSAGGLVGKLLFVNDGGDFVDSDTIRNVSVNATISGAQNMGGLVGYVDGGDGITLDIEKSSFTGSIKNSCSTNPRLGGLVGNMNGSSGDQRNYLFEQNSVNADIVESYGTCSDVTLTFTATDSAFVGGLVGECRNNGSDNLSIVGNSVVGKVQLDGAASTGSSVKFAGYIVGFCADAASDSINANYHYGSDTLSRAVGNLDKASSATIYGNIRNAVGTLESNSGAKDYGYEFSYLNTTDQNGISQIWESSEMTSTRALAFAMNQVLVAKGRNSLWTQDVGVNDSLPYCFESGAVNANYPVEVVFQVSSSRGITADESSKAKAVVGAIDDTDTLKIYLFTDSTGALDKDVDEILSGLVSASGERDSVYTWRQKSPSFVSKPYALAASYVDNSILEPIVYNLSTAYTLKYFMVDDDDSLRTLDNFFVDPDSFYVLNFASTYMESDEESKVPVLLHNEDGVLKQYPLEKIVNGDEAVKFGLAAGSNCSGYLAVDDEENVLRNERCPVTSYADDGSTLYQWIYSSTYLINADALALVYPSRGYDVSTVNLYFGEDMDYSDAPVTVSVPAYNITSGEMGYVSQVTHDGSADEVQSVYLGDSLIIDLPDVATNLGYKTAGWEIRLAAATDTATLRNNLFGSMPEDMTESEIITAMMGGSNFYVKRDSTGMLELNSFVKTVTTAVDASMDKPIVYGVAFVPKYELIEYTITYDLQTESDVNLFAAPKWDNSNVYTIDENLANNILPKFFKADSCFMGWGATKSSASGYENFSGDLLMELMEENPDTTDFTLYAIWSDKDDTGAPCTSSKIVTLENYGPGILELRQYSMDESDSLIIRFTASDEDATQYSFSLPMDYSSMNSSFKVFSVPDSGSILDSMMYKGVSDDDFVEFDDGLLLDLVFAEIDTVLMFKAKYLEVGPYNIVFDLTSIPVLVGDKETVTLDSSKMFFAFNESSNVLNLQTTVNVDDVLPFLYNADGYVTEGWKEDQSNEVPFVEYSLDFHHLLENGNGDTARAYWMAYSGFEDGYAISSDADNGSISLVQQIGSVDISHEVTSDGFNIPRSTTGNHYTFRLNVVPDSNFVLVGKVRVEAVSDYGNADVSPADGQDLANAVDTITGYYDNDSLITLPGLDSVQFQRYAVKLYAEMAPYVNVALNTNTQDSVLYFGSDWQDSVRMIASENVDSLVELPQYVYTSSACVLGWMPVASGADEFFVTGMENGSLWAALKEAGSETLYAEWGEASQCEKSRLYNIIHVEVDSTLGEVAFAELVETDVGVDTLIHEIADDGSLLVPMDGISNILLLAKPSMDSVVFDSVVVTYTDVMGVVMTATLINGEFLPEIFRSAELMNIVFQANFTDNREEPVEPDVPEDTTVVDPDVPEDTTIVDTTVVAFSKTVLQQSGNAVSLMYAVTEFNASDSAKLILTIEGEGMSLDTVLAAGMDVSRARGFWEMMYLEPGYYLVSMDLTDGDSSAHYERDFEVEAYLTDVSAGKWAMVSLGYVDFSDFVWDDDPRFYWWDEQRNYGAYWQYQEFTKENTAEMGRGYWYSSEEGRPLALTGKPVAEPVGEWELDSVYSGWNLVANPYGWYVDLCAEETCASENEKSDVAFYRWNSTTGDYEPVTMLKPYEAVWAKVSGPKTWKLPTEPTYIAEVDSNGETVLDKASALLFKANSLAKANSASNWSLQVSLADENGLRDDWNVIGVGDQAWNAEEPPEGMGDHVNLSVMEGKMGLTKSFRKALASNAYEWTVELSATGNRNGYLSIAGIEELNAYGLKVFVTVDGETTELSEGENLKVALTKSAKQATIRVANAASRVIASRIEGLKAVQTAGLLQVSFTVTEGLAGAKTQVNLMDMKGQVLRSVSGRTQAGENQISLELPKSGLYYLHVRAGNQVSADRILVK